MRMTPLPIPGAWLLEMEPHRDERGYFARAWDVDALRGKGLAHAFAQCSVSFNERAGTVRGLHLQRAPHGEAKIIRCTRGEMVDVLVDAREDSPTRHRWCSVRLSQDNLRAVYAPEGVAHGFQTLVDATEVLYHISSPYVPEASTGFRHDDPAFAIQWPLPVSRISARDAEWPLLPGGFRGKPGLRQV